VQLLEQEAGPGFVFELLLIEAVGPVAVAAGLLEPIRGNLEIDASVLLHRPFA